MDLKYFCKGSNQQRYQGQGCVCGWVFGLQHLSSWSRPVLARAWNGWVLQNHKWWEWRTKFTSGRVGLSYAKFLPRDTEWEGSFEVPWLFRFQIKSQNSYKKVRKKTLLNKDDIPCSEVNQTSHLIRTQLDLLSRLACHKLIASTPVFSRLDWGDLGHQRPPKNWCWCWSWRWCWCANCIQKLGDKSQLDNWQQLGKRYLAVWFQLGLFCVWFLVSLKLTRPLCLWQYLVFLQLFRIPTTRFNLACSAGLQRRQDVTWIGSGLTNWDGNLLVGKKHFSKSPINGVAPCSRVEDITSYQNALSKALLVSCSHLLQHSPPASSSLKGALAEAQWDDRLYAPLCCQVSFLAPQVLQWS